MLIGWFMNALIIIVMICVGNLFLVANAFETTWQSFLLNNCSYFIKLLLEKKYALPHRVLDATVAHFMRFLEDTRIMPVIWHQSLLAFVQRLVTFTKELLLLPDWHWEEFLFPRIICSIEHTFGSLTPF